MTAFYEIVNLNNYILPDFNEFTPHYGTANRIVS